MKEIKAIIQPFMVDKVLHALACLEDLPGVTVSQVVGWGKGPKGATCDVVHQGGHAFSRKTKIEIVVTDEVAETVLDTIIETAHTGRVGDGKVFVLDVAQVVRVRTGERDRAAL